MSFTDKQTTGYIDNFSYRLDEIETSLRDRVRQLEQNVEFYRKELSKTQQIVEEQNRKIEKLETLLSTILTSTGKGKTYDPNRILR